MQFCWGGWHRAGKLSRVADANSWEVQCFSADSSTVVMETGVTWASIHAKGLPGEQGEAYWNPGERFLGSLFDQHVGPSMDICAKVEEIPESHQRLEIRVKAQVSWLSSFDFQPSRWQNEIQKLRQKQHCAGPARGHNPSCPRGRAPEVPGSSSHPRKSLKGEFTVSHLAHILEERGKVDGTGLNHCKNF